MTASILTVDDSPSLRMAIRIALTGAGYDVTEAGDGVEGLAAAGAKRFDLIITDLNMPNMDGFQFLEELRADAELKRTVVFILSTSSRDQDRSRAYDEHVAGYMVKSAVGPQFAQLAQFITKYATTQNLPTMAH